MKIGDMVEWELTLGGSAPAIDRGVISRIAEGRVFVRTTRTNRRGRPRTKVCEFYWDRYEIHALRVVAPTAGEMK